MCFAASRARTHPRPLPRPATASAARFGKLVSRAAARDGDCGAAAGSCARDEDVPVDLTRIGEAAEHAGAAFDEDIRHAASAQPRPSKAGTVGRPSGPVARASTSQRPRGDALGRAADRQQDGRLLRRVRQLAGVGQAGVADPSRCVATRGPADARQQRIVRQRRADADDHRIHPPAAHERGPATLHC